MTPRRYFFVNLGALPASRIQFQEISPTFVLLNKLGQSQLRLKVVVVLDLHRMLRQSRTRGSTVN